MDLCAPSNQVEAPQVLLVPVVLQWLVSVPRVPQVLLVPRVLWALLALVTRWTLPWAFPPGGGDAPNGPGDEEVEMVGRLPGMGGEGLPGILGAPGADGAKGAPTGLPIPMDGARGALGVPAPGGAGGPGVPGAPRGRVHCVS